MGGSEGDRAARPGAAGQGDRPFFRRLDESQASLTPAHARIAAYYRAEYRRAVFYSLAEAAEAIGVSEASVIRFARRLGYDGFAGMQAAVQAYVSASMRTTVERFRSLEEGSGAAAGWEQIMDSSIRSLRALPQLVSAAELRKLAASLKRYRPIQIVGFESTAGFADYAAYYLCRAGFPAEPVTERSGDLFPLLGRAGKGSLVLALLVARYPGAAVRFCRACRRRGAELAVVSDTADHPLREEASYRFSVATRRSEGMNLEIQAAFFALLQLLILQAGLYDVEKTRTALAALESYNADFRVFD